jgi:cellulose synthase/poly-beta-1,6-N-acetylglucosamine synthase-like glycosyltransferase
MFDMSNLPTVTIGCPIANRKYLVNRYLDAIYKLDYPKDKIKLYFLINNCTDGTDFELRDFQRMYKDQYVDIVLEKYNAMSFRKDVRLTQHRLETYKRLAELRNYVLSKIDTDYFFSVDSDIIVNPNVLMELLKTEKDIIAAVINNDKITRPYNKYPYIRTNLLIHDGKGIIHYYNFPIETITEVGYTGAVYLMAKKVAEQVKYEYNELGEDISFCENAQKLGYKIYAHTGLWQKHIMCEYQDYCIQNKCQNPCVVRSEKFGKKINVYRYKYIDNIIYPDLICCPNLKKGDKSLLNN